MALLLAGVRMKLKKKILKRVLKLEREVAALKKRPKYNRLPPSGMRALGLME